MKNNDDLYPDQDTALRRDALALSIERHRKLGTGDTEIMATAKRFEAYLRSADKQATRPLCPITQDDLAVLEACRRQLCPMCGGHPDIVPGHEELSLQHLVLRCLKHEAGGYQWGVSRSDLLATPLPARIR